MLRALELARAGIGQTSPNPLVGAVLVREGKIVGEGTYTYADIKHAEAKAVEQAGELARGATLYINLEPCSHYGRTPPCAELLIARGVSRVVAAIEDPNPLVSGRGFAMLRAAGIQVETGLLAGAAARLNEAFAKFVVTGRPFVLLKAAMTADGKIASFSGKSRWITSPAARDYSQRLRREYDAILVGINTLLCDNPQLNYRLAEPKRRPLIRVILDARLRTPQSAAIFDRAEPVLILAAADCDSEAKLRLERVGAEVIIAPASGGQIDLDFVCRELGKRQVSSLIIEGGAEVNWSALAAGIVDKLLLILAPKILGGRAAVPVVGGSGFELDRAVALDKIRIFRIGPDIALEGYPVFMNGKS